MIPSADAFLANKWKITYRGWYKLGVEVIEQETLIFDNDSSCISIYFYLDPGHLTFSSLYIKSSGDMKVIEKAIKLGVQNILQNKSYTITPKSKRTLKNWVL